MALKTLTPVQVTIFILCWVFIITLLYRLTPSYKQEEAQGLTLYKATSVKAYAGEVLQEVGASALATMIVAVYIPVFIVAFSIWFVLVRASLEVLKWSMKPIDK